MRVHNLRVHLVLAILFLTSFAAGETLTGTVKNSTTGKPSAGDEIVLLKLGQGSLRNFMIDLRYSRSRYAPLDAKRRNQSGPGPIR